MGSYLPCFCAKNICSCVMECMCTLCLCYCPLHVTLSVNVTRFFSLGCRGGLWCHLIVIILFTYILPVILTPQKDVARASEWRHQLPLVHLPSEKNKRGISGSLLSPTSTSNLLLPRTIYTCTFRIHTHRTLIGAQKTVTQTQQRLESSMGVNTRYIFTHTRVIVGTQVFAVEFVWPLFSAN